MFSAQRGPAPLREKYAVVCLLNSFVFQWIFIMLFHTMAKIRSQTRKTTGQKNKPPFFIPSSGHEMIAPRER